MKNELLRQVKAPEETQINLAELTKDNKRLQEFLDEQEVPKEDPGEFIAAKQEIERVFRMSEESEKSAHAEQEIREMVDKIYSPNYLPKHGELKNYFDKVGRDSQECAMWTGLVKGEQTQIFEIYTEEFIRGLAKLLIREARNKKTDGKPMVVLEVGAGNGKLTHFLNEALEELSPGTVKIVATDSGQWEIKDAYEEGLVEKIGYKKALEKYKPTVVLASWMPHEQDWTADFRATDSVKEYVLVGEAGGCCGDMWQTWGINVGNNDGQTAPYKTDDFQREYVEDLSDMQFSRLEVQHEGFTSTNIFRRGDKKKKNGRWFGLGRFFK